MHTLIIGCRLISRARLAIPVLTVTHVLSMQNQSKACSAVWRLTVLLKINVVSITLNAEPEANFSNTFCDRLEKTNCRVSALPRHILVSAMLSAYCSMHSMMRSCDLVGMPVRNCVAGLAIYRFSGASAPRPWLAYLGTCSKGGNISLGYLPQAQDISIAKGCNHPSKEWKEKKSFCLLFELTPALLRNCIVEQ
jgi:hypothetical protein